MTKENGSKKGSNLGCLLKFVAIIIGIKLFLFLLNAIKRGFIDDDNGLALTVFHNDYFSPDKFYVTAPVGTFGARMLIALVISFVLIMLLYGISSLLKVDSETKGNLVKYVFWGLIGYFLLMALFIPHQKVVIETSGRVLKFSEYDNNLYFLQSPFPSKKFDIRFEEVTSFKYSYYDDTFRGSTNYFLDLYCLTKNGDTLELGHTMTHHGEFDVFDFKSQAERDSIATEQGLAAVEALRSLIK